MTKASNNKPDRKINASEYVSKTVGKNVEFWLKRRSTMRNILKNPKNIVASRCLGAEKTANAVLTMESRNAQIVGDFNLLSNTTNSTNNVSDISKKRSYVDVLKSNPRKKESST